MKKQANIGLELSTETLDEVHGGRLYPFHSPSQAALQSAAKAVANGAKSVWNTIASWF